MTDTSTTTIYGLIRHCALLPYVRAIALVGSQTLREGQAGDWDILAFTDLDGSPDAKSRRTLWSSPTSPIDLQAIGENNDRFTFAGARVELDYRPMRDVDEKLDKAVNDGAFEAEANAWLTIADCPEAACAEIADCLSLWDPEGIINVWKSLVSEYPAILQANLLGHVLFEARFKLKDMRRADELGDVALFHMALSHLCFCLLRMLYAINRTYFRGIKRCVEGLSQFTPLPRDCRGRMERLLCAGLSPARLNGLYDEAAALLRETAHLALEQGTDETARVIALGMEDWPDIDPLD